MQRKQPRRLPALAATLGLAVSELAGQCAARPEYVARIPNANSIPGVPALGHVDPAGGGARNAFGEAFEAAGFQWTVELCLEDSDGDGATNGQELGDPCCVYQGAYDSPTFTDGTSHPGNASSILDKTILYQWVCGYHHLSGSSFGSSFEQPVGANPAPAGSIIIEASNSTTASSSGFEFPPGGKNATSTVSPTPISTVASSTCASSSLVVALSAAMMSTVL